MRILASLLLFLGAVTIFGAFIILAPDEPSKSFWLALCWIEFLWVLNWYTSTLIFSGPSDRLSVAGNLFGVLPSISITVFIYSIFSALSLALFLWQVIGATLHGLLQLCGFGLTSFFAISAFLALKGATSGTHVPISQKELLDAISRLKRNTHRDLACAKIIDEMHKFILYKLPPPVSLNPEDIESIYLDIMRQSQGGISIESLKKISESLQKL